MVNFTSPATATVTGYATCDGKWTQKTMELERCGNGTWHRRNFNDALQETGQSAAAQSDGCAICQSEKAVRKKLSNQEIAELSGKYDVYNMNQTQYDAFLDELVEKGALTRADPSWLGRGGLVRLDIDMDEFLHSAAEGRLMNSGTAYVTSAASYVPGLDSLEDAGGDLLRWLENMLARMSLGIDPSTKEGGREKEAAVNALRDIVRRMQAPFSD